MEVKLDLWLGRMHSIDVFSPTGASHGNSMSSVTCGIPARLVNLEL